MKLGHKRKHEVSHRSFWKAYSRMTNARFVLDTNVIISALLLPRSVPRQAFDLAFARGSVLASAATLDELDEVLRRKKFDQYVLEEKRLQFLAAFIRDSVIVV